ncbi:hypothetical protein K7X08_037630 [Anisodus acutangulus]|uniref:Cytochrome P450 n=1 Tax=Anisodus acutangulus TaxID=402998 RepID=A0A9Q1RST8_9SOLA|nr:hypothetical protein K7X08_037630 [Anisodus acutangulus]
MGNIVKDLLPWLKVPFGRVQLRDDLLSMLVAGHETTGSVLTWTAYLLSKEYNLILYIVPPFFLVAKYISNLNFCLLKCSLPALKISKVWERAEEFDPERFDLEGPVPNETNTDFRFIPFSGGPRKCVGDQFALLEATVALAIFLQNFSFELIPDQNISTTTGATIHTTNGLYMKVKQMQRESVLAAAL